jgi:hypothetical protein
MLLPGAASCYSIDCRCASSSHFTLIWPVHAAPAHPRRRQPYVNRCGQWLQTGVEAARSLTISSIKCRPLSVRYNNRSRMSFDAGIEYIAVVSRILLSTEPPSMIFAFASHAGRLASCASRNANEAPNSAWPGASRQSVGIRWRNASSNACHTRAAVSRARADQPPAAPQTALRTARYVLVTRRSRHSCRT